MKKITFIILINLFSFTYSQNLIELAKEIINKDSIPEMAFAVVTKDSILIKEVIGHHSILEINGSDNADITDYFHLGFNTKAITGFIAANLVEKEKISWETKFFDLFPELRNKSNSMYYNITLDDLLSHRAKIRPFTSGAEFIDIPKFKGNKQERRKKFVEYILKQPPIINNKKYNYSNAGYSVATIMLEKVTGKSWESLLTEILTKNLRIEFIIGWPNRSYKNQPYGHWVQDKKIQPVQAETNYNLDLIEPAGNISMNIDNYIKFIQLNIQGLSGKDNLLSSKTYEFLHSSKEEYAIGWLNYNENGEEISEHAGSDGTFFAYTQINRKKLIGYIIIVNSGTETAQNDVFEMINLLKKFYSS